MNRMFGLDAGCCAPASSALAPAIAAPATRNSRRVGMTPPPEMTLPARWNCLDLTLHQPLSHFGRAGHMERARTAGIRMLHQTMKTSGNALARRFVWLGRSGIDSR